MAIVLFRAGGRSEGLTCRSAYWLLENARRTRE